MKSALRPSIQPCVDVVLLTIRDEHLQVLLYQRDNAPYQGAWALPGGYFHPQEDDSAEAAALRVLKAKTGIVPPYLEQLRTFSGPKRDPRGWSLTVAYYALVPWPVLEGVKNGACETIPVSTAHNIPFDHVEIIREAVARLRTKGQYSSLPCYLAGTEFTLPALQIIYEQVIGEPLNKAAFRKKIQDMGILEMVVGKTISTGPNRPAQVYRLKKAFRSKLALLTRGV